MRRQAVAFLVGLRHGVGRGPEPEGVLNERTQCHIRARCCEVLEDCMGRFMRPDRMLIPGSADKLKPRSGSAIVTLLGIVSCGRDACNFSGCNRP